MSTRAPAASGTSDLCAPVILGNRSLRLAGTTRQATRCVGNGACYQAFLAGASSGMTPSLPCPGWHEPSLLPYAAMPCGVVGSGTREYGLKGVTRAANGRLGW